MLAPWKHPESFALYIITGLFPNPNQVSLGEAGREDTVAWGTLRVLDSFLRMEVENRGRNCLPDWLGLGLVLPEAMGLKDRGCRELPRALVKAQGSSGSDQWLQLQREHLSLIPLSFN